jgi:UDP-glucose 4-epimerase
MNKKNVLITGGAGFVGSHIVKKFADEKYDVSVLDVKDPVVIFPKGVKFIKGSIFDKTLLKSLVEPVDVIIHLIGIADSSTVEADPQKSFSINIESLQNILEMCRICGNKKIIFPSSASVYGTTSDLPIKENFPLNPASMYAWHKLICENLVHAYHKSWGVNYAILRLFNIYGKGNEGVIGIFLNKARRGDQIDSFGPFQYRDFVYAGDVAEAIFNASVYDKAMNRTINIGSGSGTQIREILDIVCNLYPNAKWQEKKANFIMYDSIADITLAKILLDFKPHTSPGFIQSIIQREMI